MKTILSAILLSLCFIPASEAAVASAQASQAFPLGIAILITGILLLSIIGLIFSLKRRRARAKVKVATPRPPRRKRGRVRGRRRRVVVIR